MADAAPAATVLTLQGVTKRFPGTIALQDVSIDLRAGEIHALCGENGAGKSTLIKVISGLWPHGSFEGALLVGGKPAVFHTIQDAEAAGIAVIHQELALVQEMTVAENIFLGHELTRGGRMDWNRMHVRATELMRRYRLDLDPQATVGSLGVGQQQMVEIVKALSRESRILLLDEPTAALTETEADALLAIIADLRARGMACFYISHRLPEVFRMADRITVLRDGRAVTTLETAGTTRDAVIRHMVGREITDFYPRRAAAPGEVLLEVAGLTVRDPASGRRLLDDVGLTVRAGEVVGIGGLMGAGRTELLMHLFGALGSRVAGRVTLGGRLLHARTPMEAIRAGLMLVSEDRKRYGLILDQSIGFNLSLAALARFARGGLVSGTREFVANAELMKTLGVKAPHQEVAVRSLSGGNQQKVVLGKAMLTQPSVFLLDEPTRGIDVGAKVDVYEVINRITEAGHAVVLVSSELPELMGMSDRIVILSEGRVGGAFTRAEATQEVLMHAAMAAHEPVHAGG